MLLSVTKINQRHDLDWITRFTRLYFDVACPPQAWFIRHTSCPPSLWRGGGLANLSAAFSGKIKDNACSRIQRSRSCLSFLEYKEVIYLVMPDPLPTAHFTT
jgi:hypothetical protein